MRSGRKSVEQTATKSLAAPLGATANALGLVGFWRYEQASVNTEVANQRVVRYKQLATSESDTDVEQ